jgi:hypothetical protein
MSMGMDMDMGRAWAFLFDGLRIRFSLVTAR